MDNHKRQMDTELDALKKKLLGMAATAEAMIDQVIKELLNRDEQFAASIPKEEEELNRLQIEIDEHALTLLATRQPVANDLRLIIVASKISSELERVGDLVINITENVHTLAQQPSLKPLIDIPRMADVARKMLRESLDAFVKRDAKLARQVTLTDDEVDGLKNQVLRELLTYMMADPHCIERALALILIARHLERIADHATNIAEDVIYLIRALDVRHPRTARKQTPAE